MYLSTPPVTMCASCGSLMISNLKHSLKLIFPSTAWSSPASGKARPLPVAQGKLNVRHLSMFDVNLVVFAVIVQDDRVIRVYGHGDGGPDIAVVEFITFLVGLKRGRTIGIALLRTSKVHILERGQPDWIPGDDCRVGAGECVGRPIEHVDRFAHGRSRRAAEEFARVLVIFWRGLGLVEHRKEETRRIVRRNRTRKFTCFGIVTDSER